VTMNAALLVGYLTFMAGSATSAWKPTKRSSDPEAETKDATVVAAEIGEG
jgi:hypothetical protein